MDKNTQASGASPAGQPTPLDLDQLVNQFVLLRDRKRVIEQGHELELKPFTKLLDEIGAKLLSYMQQTNVDSVSTPSGTAHQITKRSATIRDGAAFRDYVKSVDAFELLDLKANAPAVFDFIRTHDGVPPPGVNASTYVRVGIRRPNEKE
jgi:hypothetical protein